MNTHRLVSVSLTALASLMVGCSSQGQVSNLELAEESPSTAGPSANVDNSSQAGPLGAPASEAESFSTDSGSFATEPSAMGAQAPLVADADSEAPEASREDVAPGEENAPATNPFVMAAHDPLSTFATDVDTASYDIFRRDVERGQLPQPQGVRVEEYVNFFQYDYPAPEFEAEQPFAIDLAAAQSVLEPERTMLRVAIAGKEAPPIEKKLTNLVFLVDVSGSMRGSEKIGLVQQVLSQTLDLLDDGDTVSVVSYASDTRVRLEPTDISNRATIEQTIAELSTGGSTNGAGGINLAYEQAEAAFIEGGINHVVLCSDGDFNVGPSSDQELVDLIRERRRGGVTFTALGFGYGNLNDSMMEAVSNAGNGFYGVISSEEQAAEYVSNRMLGSLGLIAKDMKVQVEFNPELVEAYRLLGYENRDIADIDFRNDLVDAGEIGAGHQVTALYEVVLQGDSLPQGQGAPEPTDGDAFEGQGEVSAEDLVLVKVRYKDVDATEEDAAFEVSESLAPAAVGSVDEALRADLDWAVGVAAFSEILKNSPYAPVDRLDALDELFSAQADRDADRLKFYELFSQAKNRM